MTNSSWGVPSITGGFLLQGIRNVESVSIAWCHNVLMQKLRKSSLSTTHGHFHNTSWKHFNKTLIKIATWERQGVSNHRQIDCLLSRLLWATIKKRVLHTTWSLNNIPRPIDVNTTHIDGLLYGRRNSKALPTRLRLICTNPSIYGQLNTLEQLWVKLNWLQKYFLSMKYN